MTNVKFIRKPFEGSLTNLVDDLFTELPGMLNHDFNTGRRKDSVPVNVQETDKSFELEVIAPGFEKADFKINVDQDLLTVSADKKSEAKKDGEEKLNVKNIRREYNYSSFKRSFTVDEKIDATNITASYINGILTLNLPKKEPVKQSAKEIVIK